MKNRAYKLICLLFISLFIITACSKGEDDDKHIETSSAAGDTTSATEADTTTTEAAVSGTDDISDDMVKETSTRLVFAGDNLIHINLVNKAAARADGNGYDFSVMYENVADFIASADLAVINQETLVTDEYEPSNFPRFATPTALGDELIKMGFDAVSVSNNHCLDKGEEGLLSSLKYWETSHPNIPLYGAYKDTQDMETIRTLEVNGITFAFVGFMEHTNGLSLPSDATAKLIYMNDLENVEKSIKKADEIADCVIVSVHFGVEITNRISEQQYEYAQIFADYGADIIVGTQPHTIQSMEYINKSDGGTAFVFYCLGNFISSQNVAISMVGMLGGITVTKDIATGDISLSDVKAVPVITQYEEGYRDVRNYLYWQYNEGLANSHGCEGFGWGLYQTLVNENIPSEYLAETDYLAVD